MITNPTGYRCPVCGDLEPIPWALAPAWRHTVDHSLTVPVVPVFKPLATPEPTTWGESHPVGAVCSFFEIDDPYMMIVSGRRFACIDGDAAAVAGPRVCHDVDDVVQAINYVAGAK